MSSFFFSSRRRHTRSYGDWSSDVCSSDLSWTNDLSWVRGYENVLDPMNKLSAKFHETLDSRPVDKRGHPYRNALFHLLVSQTSCYRYWGHGRWTDFAREICRRGNDILTYDF